MMLVAVWRKQIVSTMLTLLLLDNFLDGYHAHRCLPTIPYTHLQDWIPCTPLLTCDTLHTRT